MRRPRQHTADDGSFGRSAGIQAGRGAFLLAVALVLGIVLLNAADDPAPDRVTAGDTADETTSTTTGGIAAPPSTVAPTLRPPAEVKLLVANGTTVKGVARKVTDQLQPAGYNVLSPTDASKADASLVYAAPGYEGEAGAVAEALLLPPTSVQPLPTPAPVPDTRGANVLVVVGPELAERVGSAAAATTTTAVAATPSSSTTAP